MVTRKHRTAIFIAIVIIALLVVGSAVAAELTPSQDDIIQGAQLYDKWYAALGVDPPTGDMPIWNRQSTNTRSGADTWRCSECHGWDYKGNQGEYQSGSHFTGFPNLYQLVPTLSADDIVNHLNGAIDPAHNFSPYLEDNSLRQLAVFLKSGIIDDSAYIDPISLHVMNPDVAHGKDLYQSTCSTCHGEDGKQIVFKIEGINEYLGSIANRDPWRFLHRTRFGVAGADMPVGLKLGWQPEDGRDILAYAQSLPTGGEIAGQPTPNQTATPVPLLGGPTHGIFGGMLTVLRTVTGLLVVAAAFIGGFVLIGLVVVTLLRGRGKKNP